MLRVTSLKPDGLQTALMGVSPQLLDLLGYWPHFPVTTMRSQRMRMKRSQRMRRRRRRMRRMKRQQRMKMKRRRQRMRMRRRQRRNGHGPACLQLSDIAVLHHRLHLPLWEHWEDLEKKEASSSGYEKLKDSPAVPHGPGPCLGEADNLGEGPQPGTQVPSAFHNQKEGGSLREDPKHCGELNMTWLEMEKHLKKVGDGQKQPLEGMSQHQQDREPKGGLEPCGGDTTTTTTTSCLHGGANPGPPVTKNPLVLSLFYCPSEEEEENERDDADWVTAEDPASPCCSDTDWTDSEGEPEDETLFKENKMLWGALCCGLDPFNPLRLATAPTPPRPKERELRVSFYLPMPASKTEMVGDPWKSPRKPWPMRWSTPSRSHCCELGSQGSKDCDKARAMDSECNQTAKKVRFSPVVTVHPLLVWSFASQAARRGPWEELARDRSRFRRRIEQLGTILEPCLEAGHRAQAWRRIHGASLELTEPFPLPEGRGIGDTSLPLCDERMEDPGVRDGRLG